MGVVYACLAVLAAPIIHELGHYGAALLMGGRIYFRFSWGWLWKIPIPRFVWDWPEGATEKQIRFICQAGFLLELGLVPFLPAPYQVAALVHFAAYPWYAGEVSDFRGLS